MSGSYSFNGTNQCGIENSAITVAPNPVWFCGWLFCAAADNTSGQWIGELTNHIAYGQLTFNGYQLHKTSARELQIQCYQDNSGSSFTVLSGTTFPDNTWTPFVVGFKDNVGHITGYVNSTTPVNIFINNASVIPDVNLVDTIYGAGRRSDFNTAGAFGKLQLWNCGWFAADLSSGTNQTDFATHFITDHYTVWKLDEWCVSTLGASKLVYAPQDLTHGWASGMTPPTCDDAISWKNSPTDAGVDPTVSGATPVYPSAGPAPALDVKGAPPGSGIYQPPLTGFAA